MTPNKWWHYLLLTVIVSTLSAIAFIGIAVAIIYPSLPSLETLTDYRPKLPLRVYSEDGYLIEEFGEERRAYVKIEDVPKNMKDAVLAIEDRRFYQHGGIDTKGILRAIKNNITGVSHEGASTITMQVAKNFFTKPNGKRTLATKINEALLAIKIENNLSKDKILELYINQIYLGQRSYGFAAAAQVYFGKPLEKLNLAETAMLAGLPKAPSGYNPYLHPKRAIARQMEVLRDMQRYGFIEESVYKKALNQPLRFKASRQARDLSADYVAEMVRESLYATYQDEIYSSGLKVYTTVRKTNQEAANNALRDGILDYDARQGYRGPEKMLNLNSAVSEVDKEEITEALSDIDVSNGLIPAAITKISEKSITVHTKYGDDVEISGKGLALIQNTLNEKKPEKRLLRIGAVIRILNNAPSTPTGQWRVVQVPQVESALISIDPETGAIRALVGGFDFNRNKFNHATQAWRQPGSSFKPFIYSAALEKGYTPATIVEDAPLSFSSEETGNKEWTPQNYDATFDGPIRLRQALAKSKNMVAIRVLDSIGPSYAQDYITRFGFAAKNHPAYMTMALGAGSATPMQMANAYAVFANGGYRVNPYLITKIVDQNGKVISQSKFVTAKVDAPRVIDARNAFIMNSMMQDVVRYGTAAKASQLGRGDLAGKTGTTNDHYDAWFTGYSPKLVAVTWVGFDKPRRLGRNETGGSTALPIWIKYMASALRNVPETDMPIPDGVMALRIDPTTGIRADNDENGIYEYFYHENPPPEVETELPGMQDGGEAVPLSQPQQILQPNITMLPRNSAPRAQDQAARPKENSAGATAKPADTAKTDQAQQLLSPH
ncbi:penicillin-binding protein 1A [Methylotenera mobilis]|uniref:Penicillin-binding protein 1A n=1 Tax=Methylotenera mobilis (strain JLW8 / ATCC BAA-1282 / DSM 17540) TaxID=583345 RepID=C6WZA6_METML|nr:penicillin-binding protein 1A [Methylotenera mobilis]ACT49054.1 penicillin-binding protein, 1A family [Methylotenera mobilis JLW8]